jgi:hypothetical protein
MHEEVGPRQDSVDAELGELDAALSTGLQAFLESSDLPAVPAESRDAPFCAPAGSHRAGDSLGGDSGGPGPASASSAHSTLALPLPVWRRQRAPWRGLLVVVIAVGVGAAVGWWLANGPPTQVVPPRLVAQTPQSQKPLAQGQQTPRSAVRTAQRRKASAPEPMRAPILAVRPGRRAPAERRPLPSPVVPPLPAISLATLARPPIVPSIPELVAPPPGPEAIKAPRILYQELPRPREIVDQATSVLLVVLINAGGRVDRAFIGSMPVIPRYEWQLVQAAKTWRYTPALQNGRAIPYRMTLRVTVPAASGPR